MSTRKFKTEIKQLLDLMIHSLYSNRDRPRPDSGRAAKCSDLRQSQQGGFRAACDADHLRREKAQSAKRQDGA